MASRSLALSDSEIERAGELLTDFLRAYERSAPAGRVVPEIDRTALEALARREFPEEGAGIDRLFAEIRATVAPNSTAIAHPRYLAYVLPPANGVAPVADAIAAALNQNCNIWQLSPAASVIERKVVSWLAGLFGYPAAAGGVLTSGGSMATEAALTVALNDRRPEYRRTGLQGGGAPLVVYTSEEAHRSVEKDAVILGLGQENVRMIPVDSEFRLRPDALAAAVEADRKAGKEPFCVVATAGTVNTGSIDPVEEIAEYCRREGLWLHVDGAYGALFVLSDRVRERLLPCGRADSIALDPHKLLFAPLEAGCVLVRDRAKLRRAFHFPSPYLTEREDPLLTNYLEYTPQLSRSFKAFKVWCALECFGLRAFRAAVERQLDLAAYMRERIEAEPRLEATAPVTLSAVCFRLRDASDEANHAALARLVNEGSALLGPVRIRGRWGIRACFANFRTRPADVDFVIERLLA
jgi:aromatic-L-amino-acid decarboxylase